jgi:hypothetical protein
MASTKNLMKTSASLKTTTMSTTMEPYTVPTKQGDDEKRPKANHVVGDSQQQHDDAFSRYSNDLLRLKATLLLSEDQDSSDLRFISREEEDNVDDLDALAAINRALSSLGMTNITHLSQGNNERRRGNNSSNNSSSIQDGNVRKTRLSWELHPILIDALDDDDDGAHISDDEGGSDDKSTEQQEVVQDQDEREEKEKE